MPLLLLSILSVCTLGEMEEDKNVMVETVLFLIMNQRNFRLVRNQKENCH